MSQSLQRYAVPLSGALAACAAGWVPTVLAYSASVFLRAPAVPAYAYVAVVFAVALPTAAFLALAAGVRFVAALSESRDAGGAGLPEDLAQGVHNRLQSITAAIETLSSDCRTRLQDISERMQAVVDQTQAALEHGAVVAASVSGGTGGSVVMPGNRNFVRDLSSEEASDSLEAAVLRQERHLYDGLHAVSIELIRLLEAAPSPDLWRRYMRGERDAFTAEFVHRFADGPLTADAYREKDDFRRMVLRYIAQYETLRERLGRVDNAVELCEFLEQSTAGQAYTALVQATADYAGAVA